jgi:hypothetical protein
VERRELVRPLAAPVLQRIIERAITENKVRYAMLTGMSTSSPQDFRRDVVGARALDLSINDPGTD